MKRILRIAALFALATAVVPSGATAVEGDLVYVASQSAASVSVIDAGTQEVVATVDLTELGFTPNCKPHHVAVEPDGSHWYVSLIADWRVLKFDRDNNLVGQVEFETPGMLSIDPVNDVLYVGRSMAAVSPPMRIGVIERSSMDIEEVDVFFARPHALMAAREGGRVYTASLAENRMAAVEPAEEVLELVDVPGNLHTFVQFALSPDGQTLVAGGQMSGEILVFDVSDPLQPELKQSLSIGGHPWHPVYSPDGGTIYFPQRTSNAVAVIDTASWEVRDTITGGGLVEPHGSAISADGRWLYVSGRNTSGEYGETPEGATPMGTLNIIDTQSGEVAGVVDVPAYAAGVGAATR
ncbi:MAG: YncE family protein [Acidobacteria bacterium]|nr:YncE family protein [Acidobacteriota bacterium]